MRTTIDLPEQLIAEAMKLTGCKTKTAVITEALVNLIQREKIRHIKQYRGKVPLEIDLNRQRKR